MTTLDLYKKRRFNTVRLRNHKTGDEQDFKIPNEYTVEEIERLLELQARREDIERTPVKDQEKQIEEYFAVIFDQLEVLFQHYQPEITVAVLKEYFTHNEALETMDFYRKNRYQTSGVESSESKKKEQKLS